MTWGRREVFSLLTQGLADKREVVEDLGLREYMEIIHSNDIQPVQVHIVTNMCCSMQIFYIGTASISSRFTNENSR